MGADDNHFVRAKRRETADDGPIFGKKAIAMKFAEVSKSGLQIIYGERAFRMARYFDAILGTQIGKDLAPGFL